MLQAPPPEPPAAVQEVVVTGARLPPAAGDLAFSIVRLDAGDLLGQTRLDEALKQVPGVSLFRRTTSTAANPTTQGLSLRAIAPSGAGRALVTLDGVPQNDPFGGWVIWAALPPEGIAAVDVVRGAGATAYGAGALTGTVSLRGLDAAGAPLRAEAAAGERGYGRLGLAWGVPIGDGGLLVTGTAERSDGWTPVRDGAGLADRPLAVEGGSAALKYDAPVGAAAMAVRLAAYDENRQSGLLGADARARGAQASVTLARPPAPDRPGWRAQAWVLASDLQNRSVAVAPDRSGTTPANDQFETPAVGLGLNGAVRGVAGPIEWELGADLRATEGETHERFRFLEGRFTRLREAGGRTLVAGAYADASYTGGPWLLTGAARLDHWTATDARRFEADLQTAATTLDARPAGRDELIPSVRTGVRRDVGATGAYVRAAGYTGFRPPTLNELHRPFRVGNDLTEANAALKPERLYGIETGAGFVRGDARMSATVFHNRLEDPIANVTIGFGPATFPLAGFVPAGGVLRQRRNVGAIEATGVEAEAERRFGAALSLRAAVAWTVAEVDGGDALPQLTGNRPAQAPRFTATASADWRATEWLTLSTDVRYESERFEDDLNSRRLDAALSVDARAAWTFGDGLEAWLGLENALDADIETGRTFDGVVSLDAPRLLRVGVSFTR